MRTIRTGSCVALGAALVLLQACTHGVIHQDHPLRLEPMPRYPLHAAVQTTSTSATVNALVVKTLRDSGYFGAVDTVAGPTTDIEIVYKGSSCDRQSDMTDSFIGTWTMTLVFLAVTVPTLGSIPPGNSGEWHCDHKFSYRLLDGSKRPERAVLHGYRYIEYKTTFTHYLLTSDAREQYQLEYSIDQAVATLLNTISQDIAAREQAR